jgi:hypothetical protein
VKKLYNIKKLIGELLGAAIAIIWIFFALLGAGNLIFLAIAISLTILFGTVSGGLFAMSDEKKDWKEILGWVFGASIGIVWICFALIAPGDMVFLVVAISLTILFGVLSGGLIKLGTNSE